MTDKRLKNEVHPGKVRELSILKMRAVEFRFYERVFLQPRYVSWRHG